MEWKNGCAEMQVGFKILLDLLERLIRGDTKICRRGSGKQGEKDSQENCCRREDVFLQSKS